MSNFKVQDSRFTLALERGKLIVRERRWFLGEQVRSWDVERIDDLRVSVDGSLVVCLLDGREEKVLKSEGLEHLVDVLNDAVLEEAVRRTLRGRATMLVSVVARRGVCRVCGSSLDGRLVTCARCRTPHHEQCWRYAGLCSTFGCGSPDATSSPS